MTYTHPARHELDRIELGVPAAICADVENTHTRWGGADHVRQLGRYATDPACPQPAAADQQHVNPWGPM